jgi:hypothetical protein
MIEDDDGPARPENPRSRPEWAAAPVFAALLLKRASRLP